MNEYRVSLGAIVAVSEYYEIYINGNSEEEAIELAKKDFDQHLNHKFGWCDYDEARVEEVVMSRYDVEE